MPRKAPTPCNHRGCKAVVQGRYCPAHERESLKGFRKRAYTERDSPSKRGYGRRWQRIRRIKLGLHPFCEVRTHCPGAVATEVDHIDGDTGNNDGTNLQSICHRCHTAKTNREQGGLGHRARQMRGVRDTPADEARSRPTSRRVLEGVRQSKVAKPAP